MLELLLQSWWIWFIMIGLLFGLSGLTGVIANLRNKRFDNLPAFLSLLVLGTCPFLVGISYAAGSTVDELSVTPPPRPLMVTPDPNGGMPTADEFDSRGLWESVFAGMINFSAALTLLDYRIWLILLGSLVLLAVSTGLQGAVKPRKRRRKRR